MSDLPDFPNSEKPIDGAYARDGREYAVKQLLGDGTHQLIHETFRVNRRVWRDELEGYEESSGYLLSMNNGWAVFSTPGGLPSPEQWSDFDSDWVKALTGWDYN